MLLVAVLAALLVLAAIGFGLILFSFFLMMQAKKAKAARVAARAPAVATPAVAPPVAAPSAPRAPPSAPPPVTPLIPPDPSASGMRRPPARGAGYADDDELQATVVMAAGATSWLDDGADGEARTEMLDRSRDPGPDTTPVKGGPDFGFLDE